MPTSDARPSTGSPESPADQITREAEAWRSIVTDVLGPDARLLSVSRYVCDSRVYATEDRIAKIRRHDPSWPATAGMAVEADVLRRLGRDVSYQRVGEWEISVQDRLAGTPFSTHLFDQQETSYGTRERLAVLRGVARELGALHRQGVSHGDLRPDNLLVDGDAVRLVDFDRGGQSSRLGAAYRDWIGVGGSFSSPTPYWKLAATSLVPKSQTLARRLRQKVRGSRAVSAAPDEPADVALLRQAWAIAERSAANARGQGLSYYALSYRGRHFPGERAWQLRWDAISRAVDFRGKRVLELGCNLGLLSHFAALHGAAEVHGVDHDGDIVEAARTAGQALGSHATFEQLDLMSDRDWESELDGRDIVTALSVVHWLPDRDRVLRFLAQHQELLYEGHDTLEIETARLRSLGFTTVDVVMTTERDRHVLIARREPR